MKIQCDVCGKEVASVFCTADEAALCQNCDNRVHNANKLASKHPRFHLFHPQFKESPSCDICQEKRALLFCQEDRALLCKECDIPIHRANEHTKKHSRFLLTGVKLSATVSSYNPAISTATATASSRSQSKTEIKNSVTGETNFQPNLTADCSESSSNPWVNNKESSQLMSQQGSVSASSMTEYLMETLPSWQVEDLMDPSSHYSFSKIYDQMSPFTNKEFEGNFGSLSSEDMSIYLPYSPAQDQNLGKVYEKKEVMKCRSNCCEEGFAREGKKDR